MTVWILGILGFCPFVGPLLLQPPLIIAPFLLTALCPIPHPFPHPQVFLNRLLTLCLSRLFHVTLVISATQPYGNTPTC